MHAQMGRLLCHFMVFFDSSDINQYFIIESQALANLGSQLFMQSLVKICK